MLFFSKNKLLLLSISIIMSLSLAFYFFYFSGKNNIIQMISATKYEAPSDAQYYLLSHDYKLDLKTANEKMRFIKNETLKQAQVKNNAIKIPKTSHKIWLTNKNKPYQIPDNILKNMILTMGNLPDYQHVLWTNDAEAIKPSIEHLKKISEDKFNFQVRDINDLPDSKTKKFAEAFLDLNAFAYASDFYRLLIIENYGGVYTDIGWILNPCLNDALFADYIFNTASNSGELNHQLIAAAPRSVFLKAVTNKINNILERDDIHKLIDSQGAFAIRDFSSPHTLTDIAYGEMPRSAILILIDRRKSNLLKRLSSSSHKEGKYGSATASTFEHEKFLSLIGYQDLQ